MLADQSYLAILNPERNHVLRVLHILALVLAVVQGPGCVWSVTEISKDDVSSRHHHTCLLLLAFILSLRNHTQHSHHTETQREHGTLAIRLGSLRSVVGFVRSFLPLSFCRQEG